MFFKSRLAAAIGLVLLAALVVGGIAFGYQRLNDRVEATTAIDATTQPPLPSTSESPAPPALNVPSDSSVVLVGDSWGNGSAAVTPDQGYIQQTAAHFGWALTVLPDGSGTGFTGPAGRSYAERIRATARDNSVRLVILEGGLNDTAVTSEDALAMNEAVDAAIAAAEQTWPNAQVMLVGPGRASAFASGTLHSVEDRLRYEAQAHNLLFLDPLTQDWLPRARLEELISKDVPYHPNTEGHDLLAKRMIEALAEAGA